MSTPSGLTRGRRARLPVRLSYLPAGFSCLPAGFSCQPTRILRAAVLWAPALLPFAAQAQTPLPPITVESKPQTQPPRTRPAPKPSAATPGDTQPAAAPTPSVGSPSANVTEAARRQLGTFSSAVSLVPDTAYRTTTPANTIKDVLDYVPGIIVQPKWGDDTRLSIRGSGLSRNFHLRGLNLYMDGIPINTADGFGDFQELDPTAYRATEVYKGASALRFGATTLGGAINFITPTGRDRPGVAASADIGSFGFHRLQSSVAGAQGAIDYFMTGSVQEQEGFRQHSSGEATRGSANIGVRLSDTVETRFYLNANTVRQRIPGSVTKAVALAAPETPAAANVADNWQRNIDTVRLANRTTVRVAPGTTLEFGVFGVDRHLMHPIFQWLDYKYQDYGAFGRMMSESRFAGYRNRLIAGVNLHNGSTDAVQYVNTQGRKGAMTSNSRNDAKNAAAYIENQFFFLPQVALVTGTQYMYAARDLQDRFLGDGDQSGHSAFGFWNPKAGLLWEVNPTTQVFANVAQSAEAPSFGENSFASAAAFDAKLQKAVTYEVGTRGRTPDFTWDLAAYRSNIENELQCTAPFGVPSFCIIQSAPKTVHQGLEIGFGAVIGKGLLVGGSRPDKVWLNTAYTYSDFRFDHHAKYGNNELPGAPRHYLRSELLYKHPSGVYFGPNVEWVARAYFVDSANTLATEPYALWGLKAGYDSGNALSFYVEGRNLADKHYIASTSITNVASAAATNFFEPGTGRAVFAGVKYRW